MSVIYLVRHGQGSFGTDNYDKLSDAGREQSRLVGKHFAAAGERIDRVYSGSLARQRKSAELLVAGLGSDPAEVRIDPAFDEYDGDALLKAFAAGLAPAELAALGWPELRRDRKRFQFLLERAARAWVDAEIAAEAMLPWAGFHGRIMEALGNLMQNEGRSKTLVVVTSGGVIGAIVAHLLEAPARTAIELNWAVHNASLTRVFYSERKVTLSMFNALPHLDRDDRRHLITYR